MNPIIRFQILFFILISTIGISFSQNNIESNKGKFESHSSFIENKGQFDGRNWQKDTKIEYGVDYNNSFVFFTKKGLTYRFDKIIRNPNRKVGKSEEKIEDAEPKRTNISELIHVNWIGANPNPEIIAEDLTDDYYSYAIKNPYTKEIFNINHIKGYKKIIYKKLYKNIDVEYIIHPESGIEYSIILHPGADLSQVQMRYSSGNTSIVGEKIDYHLNELGEIQIKTSLSEIVEHKPFTFYKETKVEINSSFKFENNILSFNLGNYDNSKEIVIDPWVQSPAFTTSTAVWEVENDGIGNVYVIGGETPMQLKKYNSTGTIQWTYTTPWDTAAVWLGTLATDNSGVSYITSGTSPEIERIDNAGGMVWHQNGSGFSDEYWSITFNCDKSKLIVGGTILNMFAFKAYAAIFDIDLNNGNVLSSQTLAVTNIAGFGAYPIEVRSISSSKNAKYIFLTHKQVGAINQNIGSCPTNAPTFQVDNGHHLGYKCENYLPATQNGGGLKALIANDQFIYTHSGNQIHKRLLSNGSFVTSVNLTGGSSTNVPLIGGLVVENSGLAVDNCGNVYAGSGDRVVKFDANLNVLSQTLLPFTVYDVSVNSNGEVLAVGAQSDNQVVNRNGRIQSVNMAACAQFALICCDANICVPDTFCANDLPTNLISASPGGVWSGVGITNTANGTFSPVVAGPGIHAIAYTLPCGSDTVFIVVSPCVSLTACQETNGNITVSSGVPVYSWQEYIAASSTPITNQAECIACGLSWIGFPLNQCGLVPVTTCNTPAYWNNLGTGATITPGTNYPILVTDGVGTTLTINSISSLPMCSSCPTLTITPANIVDASCSTLGSFSVTTSAGTSPYDYTLFDPGSIIVGNYNNVAGSQSFTGLAAGVYSLYVVDNNGCDGWQNVTISQTSTPVTITITGATSFCTGSSTTLDAGAGYTSYLWSTGAVSQTINVTLANTYSVTVSNASGCTGTASVTVTVSASLTPTVTGNNFCAGASTILDAGNGYTTYLWSTGGNTQTISVNSAGTYTVTVTSGGGGPSVFWTEAFQNGCVSGCNATGYSGTNGPWTVTLTGANGADANAWFVSGTECGNAAGACGTTCGATDPSLHVGSTTIGNDPGAAYMAGGLGFWFPVTDKRAESPAINCTGKTNITLSFNYIENGQNLIDNATLWYFDGTVWAPLFDLVKTAITCAPQGLWTSYSISLPVSADNNPGIKIGFRWVNNDDNVGTDPSFAVDDIQLSSPSAGSCSGTGQVTVSINPDPTPSITGTLAICSGSSTILDAGGGYSSYLWSTGAITQTISVSAAGNYSVTITNASSCTGTTQVTVTISSSLSPVISGTTSFCAGASSILDAGAGYSSYLWSTGAITQTITVSAAGNYSVTVSNASGCTGTTQVTVTISSSLTPVISGATSFCTGGNTVLDAGTGYTSYLWSTGAITQTINVTTAGTYSVTVANVSGCTGTASVVVTVSTSLSPAVTGNNLCAGGSTVIDAGNGYSTYLWSTGAITQTISVFAANTYSVTVTNATGCSGTGQIIISQNSNPTPTIIGLLSFCTGFFTTLDAGIGYTGYLWSNAAITQTISVSSAGNYIVTVTDNNGCTGTDQVTVTVSSNLSPVITGNLQICNGSSTSLDAGSGYSAYLWSNGQLTQSISVNTAGNYSVTVSDASGCTGIASTTVILNPNPIPVITGNLSMCSGDTTYLDAGSGYSSYLWSSLSTVQNITVTSSGVYSVTVTNLLGCSGTASVTVAETNGVLLSAVPTHYICNGEWAYLTATATGGSAPFTYYWNNVISSASIGVNPNTTTNYQAYVIDINGCTSNTVTVVVNVTPSLQVDVFATPSSICPGDTVQLTASIVQGGIPPYTIYTSSGQVVIPPVEIVPTVSGLQWLYVKDGCGSTAHDSVYITVNSSPQAYFVSDTVAGCEPLTVAFTPMYPISGQTYLWNFDDASYNQISYDINPVHEFIQDGIYDISLTVTSANGCSTTYTHNQMINVYPNPDASFITDPISASIVKPEIHFINLSEGADSYIWSFGDGDSSSVENPWHWYPSVGSYYVYLVAITDLGCADTVFSGVNIREEYTFYAPTYISPDFDEINDIFYVLGVGISSKDFHMYIYDRWGEIIYQTDMYDSEQPKKYGWDGSAKGGAIVPIGSYTWLVKYYDGDHIEHDRSGVVNVIR